MHVLAHLQHRFHAMATIARRILKVLADISPGAEAATGSRENYCANLIVIAGIAQGREDLVDHHLRIRIEFFRAIQGHRGDMTALGIQNLLEFLHRPVNFGARFSRNARTPSL